MVQTTFKQSPVTLIGNEVKVGDTAPDFSVLANDLSEVTLKDSEGKIRSASSHRWIQAYVTHKQENSMKRLQGSAIK